jgi:D-methionine transport system permease protein
MLDARAIELYLDALFETLYLVFGTGIFVLVIGFIIGFILYATEPKSPFQLPKGFQVLHRIIASINDIARSIPFIILLIMMIPVTRAFVGTILGPTAALPSLIISASPFFARVVHMALKEVTYESIEALKSMGATQRTTVRIIVKEALPALVSGYTLTLVTLVGFIAAAAVIGAGGLAYLAYEYGKFGNNYPLMYLSIVTILLIVFVIQITGDVLSRALNHRTEKGA